MLKLFFSLILIGFGFQLAYAQTATDTGNNQIKSPPAGVLLYYQSLGEQSPLYNGNEYLDYAHIIRTGHPYFNSTEFSAETIHFDGMAFENIMLMYDVVKDKVIVQHFNTFFKVDLPVKKVERFTKNGHNFIRLSPDTLNVIAEGFYETAFQGETSLYIKRRKAIREENQVNEIYNVVDVKDAFYLKKGGAYYYLKNMRSLLKFTGNNKEQIQQYLRKSGVKYKNEPEKAMIMAVEFYNR